jgi:hypothetical protein
MKMSFSWEEYCAVSDAQDDIPRKCVEKIQTDGFVVEIWISDNGRHHGMVYFNRDRHLPNREPRFYESGELQRIRAQCLELGRQNMTSADIS